MSKVKDKNEAAETKKEKQQVTEKLDNSKKEGLEKINSLDSILNELPKDTPPEIKDQIKKSLRVSIMQSSLSARLHQGNDLSEKITPEHMTDIIKSMDKKNDREFKDKNYNRLFIIAIVVVFILGVFLLKDYQDLLKTILPPAIALIAGSFGGYGFGYKKGKNESDD